MSIIAISGRIASGKDTVGKIIQYLVDQYGPVTQNGEICGENTIEDCIDFIESGGNLDFPDETDWEIRKFADKLKDIVCLLIGCTREQLEDREFKEAELGEEWWYYSYGESLYNYSTEKIFLTRVMNSEFLEPCIEEDLENCLIKLTPRKLLQLLGTECGRNIIHPNVWVNSLFTDYTYSGGYEYDVTETPYGTIKSISTPRAVKGEYPNWIITDMRFPNEFEAVKQRNGITIRINRPTAVLDGIGYNNGDHPSEIALDHVTDWDYVIDNSGTIEELVEKVRTILVNEKII